MRDMRAHRGPKSLRRSAGHPLLQPPTDPLDGGPDRVGAPGSANDRVGAPGTAWLPVHVESQLVGWFWPHEDRDLGSLKLYLFSGTGQRAEPILSRASDGRMLDSIGCIGQPTAQYVIWIWTNPGLGTAGYYSDFLGWVSLRCQDAKLFARQMKYGFSAGVQGPFGPQGYVV